MSKSPNVLRDQSTPEQVAAKYRRAVTAGDVDRAMECFYCPSKEYKAFEAAYVAYNSTAVSLSLEIVRVYGREWLNEYRKAKASDGYSHNVVYIPPAQEPLEGVHLSATDNGGMCSFPVVNGTVHVMLPLLRRGSTWYLKPRLTDEDMISQGTDIARRWTTGLKEGLNGIGRVGLSPRQLKEMVRSAVPVPVE